MRCEWSPRSSGAKVASTLTSASPGGACVSQGAVEGDEREALLLRAREQGLELEQGLRGPLPLVGDERLPVSALEYPPRLLDPGTLEVDNREAGVLERL